MSAQRLQKVAVAGANGSLGPHIIGALVKEGFEVLVLTTNSGKTAAALADASAARIVEVEYTLDKLVPILRGQDVVISLISRLQPKPQNVLADAAAEAGVPRLLPSFYGAGSADELRTNPAVVEKAEIVDHVHRLVDAGKITYTEIRTSAFFDWALERGIFLNVHGTTMRMNGGDVRISATDRNDIAVAVVNILKNPDATKNKDVCIQSVVTTQNELLKLAREVAPDHEFKTMDVNTQALWDKSQEAYDRGERSAQVLSGFLIHGLYGSGLAVHDRNDNELLGVKMWSDEKVKEFIANLVARPVTPHYSNSS